MSWESVEDAGRDAVGWSMIADYAKRRYESARTFIADKLSAQNSRGIDVEAGGQIIGSVSCGAAKDVPDVTDDIAFLAYVMDNHPDALRVDGRWKEQFLKRLAKVNGKHITENGTEERVSFWDKSTGEVVPGVELVRSRPYWRVSKDPDAKQRMNELLSGIEPSKAIAANRWVEDTIAGAIGEAP